MPINFLFRLKLLLLFIIVGLLVGMISFYNELNDIKVPADQTEVLVILTGASGKIDKGLKLLEQQKIKKLFISGFTPKFNKLAFNTLLSHCKIDRSYIIIGCIADDMISSAVETNLFFQLNDINNATILTSDYNIPRTKLVFNSIIPDIITLYYLPVIDDKEVTMEDRIILANEILKFITMKAYLFIENIITKYQIFIRESFN